ncbi:hypothetical protein BCR35DRAFT_303017 [Leucosporidium creatinivorum]|uniref:Prefoldin n=1 Tax=Leucosporidium creatinivorum TaxID=106004 RepID=A0A1Y2FL15_9BASI|nr:hypothetical protein BCR35DRAFT_303017 [Leucosporidium creatinivorum]
MDPTLPLPTELRTLLAQHTTLRQSIAQHQDLLTRLASLLEARSQGHGKMELPVELGMGYSVEGVVEDTSKMITSLGVQDLWVELELEKAREFAEKKLRILEKRVAGLEEPIKKLKEEYALVAKTLRDALQLPDPSETAP